MRRFDPWSPQSTTGCDVQWLAGRSKLDGGLYCAGEGTGVGTSDRVDGLTTAEDHECWHAEDVSSRVSNKVNCPRGRHSRRNAILLTNLLLVVDVDFCERDGVWLGVFGRE